MIEGWPLALGWLLFLILVAILAYLVLRRPR